MHPLSWMRIAAMLILIIGAAGLGYYLLSDQPVKNLVVVTQQQPLADTLPDGSQITINAGGSISYQHSFNRSDRQVTLRGEAYFNIVPDKARPFIIKVDALTIKVTGTSFNVRKRDSEETVEVQVTSGMVEMHANNQVLTLKKGQTGIFEKHTMKLKLEDGVDLNGLSYATKTFSFNDLSLKETCAYLESAFRVKIHLDEKKFAECRITTTFQNKSLSYILEVINATLNTSYRQQGNDYFIDGQGCN